jgi:hypothetical protein
METVEKGTEEDFEKLKKTKDQLVEEYIPLKDDVDRLRRSLDVEALPHLAEEGIEMPRLLRQVKMLITIGIFVQRWP